MENEKKEIIARRAAKFLKEGDVVNLGIGLPTQVVKYLPEDFFVVFQSENGCLGHGPVPEGMDWDKDSVDAGGNPIHLFPGGACFDSAFSFGLIRGKHVDVTVLGAMQVDQEGNLANWIVPGKRVAGMGGAMDLAIGANTVIVTMEHTSKSGDPKILEKCTFPLTAQKAINYIVTELCTLKVTPEGLLLTELAPGVTIEEVVAKTDAKLTISCDLNQPDILN